MKERKNQIAMKEIIKWAMCASLLAIALNFTACQKEYDPVIETSEEETMTTNSAATNLLTNIVSKDGSFDNIIDGSSCFDIRFPYSVALNGSNYTMNSVDDFREIEEILDALEASNTILEIIFPVTITLADYAEITIESLAELREHSNICVEDGNDEDIECIDIVYPLTFYTYNQEQQQTGTITVAHDKETRRFFAGMDAEDIVSLNFPVQLQHHDGTKVTVNTMAELTSTIENVVGACDEDDDNDHNDDDFTKERFDALVVECPWLVKELKRNEQYYSEQYENYLMNFDSDGSVMVKDRAGAVSYGRWETRISDYRVLLNVEIDELVNFTMESFVFEIDAEKIRLYASDGDKIMLKTTCGGEPEVCDSEYIKETLSSCRWGIVKEEDSTQERSNLDFSYMNIHVRNVNGELEDEGTWTIEGDVLVFNNLAATMANYNGQWTVVDCSSDRFKIKRGDEYLVLEKECE